MSGLVGEVGARSGVVGSASTDVSNKFVRQSGWLLWNAHKCFKFDGFIFCNLTTYRASPPAASDIIYVIDSDLRPNEVHRIPTVSHQGDTADYVEINPDGNINIPNAHGSGDTAYYVVTNFWYRLD
tara:strand:+ start:161 stop:538 length:378 start_codon:yes stop_codon:yes gene_type:complete